MICAVHEQFPYFQETEDGHLWARNPLADPWLSSARGLKSHSSRYCMRCPFNGTYAHTSKMRLFLRQFGSDIKEDGYLTVKYKDCRETEQHGREHGRGGEREITARVF
jgi:hypothetical protein